MTSEDNIIDKKNCNMISTKRQEYYQVNLMNMNMLQVKKHYLLIKVELQNKQALCILH